jgi:uncharacterized phage infection (PIP) family protein YhgE
MEKLAKLINDDANISIKIIDDAKLNHLFNLTYSFDILKSAITTLFKNQENLQKKLKKAIETNNEQNKYIETLQKQIKDNYTTKEEAKKLDTKLTEINDALIESN